MFLEPRRKTLVSSDAFYSIWFLFDFSRYSRNKQIIGVHPAVNKRFGDIALDGEIWYLSLHMLSSFLIVSSH